MQRLKHWRKHWVPSRASRGEWLQLGGQDAGASFQGLSLMRRGRNLPVTRG